MRQRRFLAAILCAAGFLLLEGRGFSRDEPSAPAAARCPDAGAACATGAPAVPQEPRRPEAAPASRASKGSHGVLRFGLYPSDSPTEMFRQFLPLCEYLTKETGYTVELEVAPSYAAGIEKFRKGEVDLFRSGAATYGRLLLEEEARPPILVAIEQDGEKKETRFRGAIVTRQDAPFRTLKDLEGKSFAFGDRRSTMGTQVPRKMLANAGVKLGTTAHLRSHDDVALAVLNGGFDAGACKAPTAEKYREKGLRILEYSGDFPSKPIYARNGLEPAKVEAVRKALLALDVSRPEHGAILAAIEAKLSGYTVDADPAKFNAEYEAFARFLGSETDEVVPAQPPGP
ncbi:MAG TPA: phosphate/phosphite/phosphonate ABC transporter substrate-binding protein [Planctomycetota bacterium]|jgi:phosphonate transport system substrate-binding protein|nr:phosphate/phosphite/phosphonate ABC transporter substrate-binding protein [Planctomycetota bacterium]